MRSFVTEFSGLSNPNFLFGATPNNFGMNNYHNLDLGFDSISADDPQQVYLPFPVPLPNTIPDVGALPSIPSVSDFWSGFTTIAGNYFKMTGLLTLALILVVLGLYFLAKSTDTGKAAINLATKI